MDTTTVGRALMGDSMGFHIIIALLAIGIPFLMNVFEFYAWRKKSEKVYAFVRLLTRWTTVLAVVGVISGTIISIQFSVLWAPFLAISRPYIGQFFMLETYAFLLEAVFLGWYLVREGKMSPGKHWLIGLPITIGAVGSAFFITIINAWMNNPSDIITATTFLEISHSVFGYLFATTLLVMGYVAWRIWRSKTTSPFPHWLIGRLALVGVILLVIVAELGHQSAVNLATAEPTKLAGIELLDKTQTNAPLRVGGSINQDGQAEGGIVFPGLLSILAGYSPDYEVHGLNEVAHDKWPMLIIHSLFDSKMLLVGFTSLIVVIALFFHWRKRRQPKWFIKIIALFGVSGIVMVELGWMITELGRQPYAIAGKLLTKDAFTQNVSALHLGYLFPILFVLLLGAMFFALSMVTKRWRKQENSEW